MAGKALRKRLADAEAENVRLRAELAIERAARAAHICAPLAVAPPVVFTFQTGN